MVGLPCKRCKLGSGCHDNHDHVHLIALHDDEVLWSSLECRDCALATPCCLVIQTSAAMSPHNRDLCTLVHHVHVAAHKAVQTVSEHWPAGPLHSFHAYVTCGRLSLHYLRAQIFSLHIESALQIMHEAVLGTCVTHVGFSACCKRAGLLGTTSLLGGARSAVQSSRCWL